jgi:hypothetical protein
MITRRESLAQALDDVEAGTLVGVSTVVVSRGWWDALSMRERKTFRARARRAGVALRADTALSTHFVEARGGDAGPPLSTERAV